MYNAGPEWEARGEGNRMVAQFCGFDFQSIQPFLEGIFGSLIEKESGCLAGLFFPRSCLVVHATWSVIASEKDKNKPSS